MPPLSAFSQGGCGIPDRTHAALADDIWGITKLSFAEHRPFATGHKMLSDERIHNIGYSGNVLVFEAAATLKSMDVDVIDLGTDAHDVSELVRLMRKFADAVSDGPKNPGLS